MRFWYSVQGYGRAEWDGEYLLFPELEAQRQAEPPKPDLRAKEAGP
jgi:hypothetical protein